MPCEASDASLMHCDDMHCEIVEKTPGVPSVFMDHGEVRINGDLVPRDVWRMVRPRAGRPNETVITLHLQLRKRANKPAGGKNTVALVVTITVLPRPRCPEACSRHLRRVPVLPPPVPGALARPSLSGPTD
jgi:hypothetical protein